MDYQVIQDVLEAGLSEEFREPRAELDEVIADTARTGVVRVPWQLLKPLLAHRLGKVLNDVFHSIDDSASQDVLVQLDKFGNPPFTIQRLCELISEPQRHYRRREAYLRALEKNLLVVSTQEPDLSWMKSPRLSQLLDERPTPFLSPSSAKSPRGLPSANTPSPSSPPISSSGSSWSGSGGPSPRSGRDTMEEEEDEEEVASSTNQSDELPGGAELSLVGRKRSSSVRESMERESMEREGEGEGQSRPVLQEADSTTVETQPLEAMEAEGEGVKRARETLPEDGRCPAKNELFQSLQLRSVGPSGGHAESSSPSSRPPSGTDVDNQRVPGKTGVDSAAPNSVNSEAASLDVSMTTVQEVIEQTLDAVAQDGGGTDESGGGGAGEGRVEEAGNDDVISESSVDNVSQMRENCVASEAMDAN